MNNRTVYISYVKVPEIISQTSYRNYLNQLPETLQQRNLRFCRWPDRLLNLFGLLQIQQGLQRMGYGNGVLNELEYNEYKRPFVKGATDFNISHSGCYVLCAIVNGFKVGVDIEEVKAIKLEEYTESMTPDEWDVIKKAADPIETFYDFWTIKESVVKADSRGLSVPLDKIRIGENNAVCDDRLWYFRSLPIDPRYRAHVSTDCRDCFFSIEEKQY